MISYLNAWLRVRIKARVKIKARVRVRAGTRIPSKNNSLLLRIAL